jgi:hypothetical protein
MKEEWMHARVSTYQGDGDRLIEGFESALPGLPHPDVGRVPSAEA